MPSLDVDQMIALLPESLNADPAGRDFLRRFLAGWVQVVALHDARIDALITIRDPSVQTDIRIVREIAAMGGWSPDLAATSGWSDEDWRRMAAVGAGIWAGKGTLPSWRQALRAMAAGRRAMVLDWFYRRATIGSWGGLAIMSDVGVDDEAGDAYSPQERVSDVWLADPLDELDRARIARVLDVCRPMGERINIRRALVVDNGGDFRQWSVTGSGRRIVSRPTPNADSTTITEGWRRLANATAALDLSAEIDAALADYTLWTEIQIGAGDAVIGVLGAPDDGLRLTFALDGTVTLDEMAGGSATLVASASADALVADVSYRLRISAVALAGGDVEVVVVIEGREVLRASLTPTVSAGPVWFACGSGAVLRFGPVLLTPHGDSALDLRRLGPAIPT